MQRQKSANDVVAENFDGWSDALREEFKTNAFNTQVGSRILSEDRRLRVWYIEVKPGERLPAHRHTRDYFWTALTDGRSIQHSDDGRTRHVSYKKGDSRHYDFPHGTHLLHDLENAGETTLEFITVEHLA